MSLKRTRTRCGRHLTGQSFQKFPMPHKTTSSSSNTMSRCSSDSFCAIPRGAAASAHARPVPGRLERGRAGAGAISSGGHSSEVSLSLELVTKGEERKGSCYESSISFLAALHPRSRSNRAILIKTRDHRGSRTDGE